MLTRNPDVTHFVDRLERAGLIAQGRDAADQRAVRVALASAGKVLSWSIDGPLIRLHQRQFAILSEVEIARSGVFCIR
jgi:DNA-binding MarR family transcriptional regulator